MSENNYQKHEWQENELITSVNLNHMEKGIEDAYKRADRQIDEIVNNSEVLTELLYEKMKNFSFEISEEEQKLIFKITNSENT